MTKHKNIILIFWGIMIFAMSTTGYAQEETQYESTHLTREELAVILKSGDVLSLEEIVLQIKRSENDRMLEVELLNYDDRLVYQIEILNSTGVVVNYFLDGKTGEDITKLLE